MRLDEVASERKGAIKIGPFGSALPRSAMVKAGVKIYGQENLIARDWMLGERRVPYDVYLSLRTCELHPGDVVIGMMGSLGHCEIFPADAEPGLMDSHLLRIQVDPNTIVPEYLRLLLLSEVSARQIDQLSHGTIMAGLSSKVVKQIKLPVPSLKDQRRIAEVLETVDQAIEAAEHMAAKLQLTASGLAGAAVAAAIAGSGVRAIGRIADETPGSLVQTGPFGSQLHASDYVDRGVATFMPTDIVSGRLDVAGAAKVSESKANELARHRLRAGDVLFGRRGDLSRCAVVAEDAAGGLCGSGCLLVRIPEVVVAADWLALVYRHDYVQRQVLARAVGSTMLNLSGGLIRSLLIPLPNAESDRLMTAFRSTEQRFALERRSVDKLRDLRTGLAADLLSGRVRTVTE